MLSLRKQLPFKLNKQLTLTILLGKSTFCHFTNHFKTHQFKVNNVPVKNVSVYYWRASNRDFFESARHDRPPWKSDRYWGLSAVMLRRRRFYFQINKGNADVALRTNRMQALFADNKVTASFLRWLVLADVTRSRSCNFYVCFPQPWA